MDNFGDVHSLTPVDHVLIKDQIQRYIEARNSFDPKRFDKIFSPEMTFEMVGPERAFPCFGRWRGLQGYKDVVALLNRQFERVQPEITYLQVNGNKVIFRKTVIARHWATGAVERLNACCLFTFRDGVVVEFIEYNDTEAMVRLLRGD